MQHGGDLTEARLRYGADDPPWLDLSTGINPHAWPVGPDLRGADWTRLPARADGDALVDAARLAYAAPPGAEVVAAPGTQALIQWLPRLAPAGEVAIVGPTYGEHAAAWRLAGREVREVTSADDAGDARHLVLVNPNNPDGRCMPVPDLLALGASCARRGGWLIVDESFVDTMPDASLGPHLGHEPIVVLRSFGKFYGLAGLRLGFALAPPPIARLLAGALGPWAVSEPALAVGRRALSDASWSRRMRSRLAAEAEALDRVLERAGLAAAGGTSLYRLVRHPDAARLHVRLAERHVWVRAFDWAPDLLRFGLPGDPVALARLARALEEAF